MIIFDISGKRVEVDEAKAKYGFKGGDMVMDGNEIVWSKNRVRIWGVDRHGNLWQGVKDDATKCIFDSSTPEQMYLVERPGLRFKVGDKFVYVTAEVEVYVINPYTNEYYLGHRSILTKDPSKADEPWWPWHLRKEVPNGFWITEAEIELDSPDAFIGGPEDDAGAENIRPEAVKSSISVPGLSASAKSGLPDWFAELLLKYKAGIGHLFILWGNVFDLQQNGQGEQLSLYQYLFEIFEQRELVLFYSLSRGLEFATPEMEERFRQRYLAPPKSAAIRGQSAVQAARAELAEDQMANGPVSKLIGESPYAVLKFLERVLCDSGENAPKTSLIIDFAHNLVPSKTGSHQSPEERAQCEVFELWAKDERIKAAGNLIVLLTPSLAGLAESLRSSHSEAIAIRLPKPSEAERTDCWSRLLASNGLDIEDGLTASKLGKITSSMGRKQINHLYAMAKIQGLPLSLDLIKREKQRHLASEFGDRIRFEEPKYGFGGFGGEEHLKSILTDIQGYILEGMTRRVPMGILIGGPPGTGKTELIRCWAWHCGFNFVKFANPRGMYVGLSEEQMMGMLAAVDDNAPVIVVEDEADQSEASRDAPTGDSGVSQRLRQMKFDFCSDESRRGKMIWVRISNRPDLLDAAYLRDGRTDYSFAMLPPFDNAARLKQIFEVMPARENIPTAIKDFTRLAELAASKIYITGSSVRKIMMMADIAAGKEDLPAVEERHVAEAIRRWTIAPKLAREIDRQTVGAIEASDTLPDDWEKILIAAKARLHEPEPQRSFATFPGLNRGSKMPVHEI